MSEPRQVLPIQGGVILRKKLHSIMSRLDYIQKDRQVSFGSTNYTYASERAIKAAIHPLMVEFGVVMTVSGVEMRVEGNMTVATYEITFMDTDSEDSISMKVFGQGSDTSDKGANKALTAAVRHGLSTMFLIPTGDDPESDPIEDKPTFEPIQPAQQEYPSQPPPEMKLPPQAHVPPPEPSQQMQDAAQKLADSIPGGAAVKTDIGGLPQEDPDDPFPAPTSTPNLPPAPLTQQQVYQTTEKQQKFIWAAFKRTGWSYGQMEEFLDGCGIPAHEQVYVRLGQMIPTKALFDQIVEHLKANERQQ